MAAPASSSPPRGTVITLSREHLERWNAEFAELDKASLASEGRVLELENSLSKATSSKMALRSQLSALQTDLFSARANPSTARCKAISANEVLNTLRVDNALFLTSQICGLSLTIDGLRLQLSTSQSSFLSAELNTGCGERDRCLSLLHSLVGQFDSFDEDYGNPLASAHNSRSSLCRRIGPLLDEFCPTHNRSDEDACGPRTS